MERQIIDLPEYELLSGITRKAKVIEANNKYGYSSVIVSVEVKHTNNGIAMPKLDGIVYLTASNNNTVNPATGEYSDAEGAIGEYEYLWNVVNVAKAYTQVELEDIYVLLRVAQIDEKLYK